MDTNIIICSDIHCRNFYKPVLDIKDKQIVFLGDYLDPYPWEDVTFENGLANLEEIIDFKKQNPDRVTLLLGNHDYNSLWKMNWASRHNYKFQNDSHALFKDNLNLFESYKVMGNILFTHAGVSEGWYKEHNINNIIDFLGNQWSLFINGPLGPFEESYLPIFDCGRSRGGYAPYGGIFWHDEYESYWTNPIDYIQIYGHTQLQKTGKIVNYVQEGKPMYCCDSRAIFEWDSKNLKLFK